MGYRTPNIDGIGNEGAAFTDYYDQLAPQAAPAFITGQNPIRCGPDQGWDAGGRYRY